MSVGETELAICEECHHTGPATCSTCGGLNGYFAIPRCNRCWNRIGADPGGAATPPGGVFGMTTNQQPDGLVSTYSPAPSDSVVLLCYPGCDLLLAIAAQ